MKIKCFITGTAVLALLFALAGCQDLTGPEGPAGADGFNGGDGPFTFTIGSNSSGPLRGAAFSAALREALEAQPGNAGSDPAAPVNLAVAGFDVSKSEDLARLYGALTRYVALDLRDCTGTVFAATSSWLYAENKAKVVSLKLPDSVLFLGPYLNNLAQEGTFTNFTGLTVIEGPGVISIPGNGYTFKGCTSLTSVNFPELSSIDGSSAFDGCTTLTSVDFPKLTSITGQYTFRNCIALTSVNLPELSSIGVSAFYDCTALTSVDLPKLGSTKGTTFHGCIALTTVKLPELTSFGNSTFSGCIALSEITLGPTLPTLPTSPGVYIFTSTGGTTINKKPITVKVPAANVSDYENWKSTNSTYLSASTVDLTIVGI
jgi:hypothetical protein